MSSRKRHAAGVTVGVAVGVAVLFAVAVAVPALGWSVRTGDAAQQSSAYTHPVPYGFVVPGVRDGRAAPGQHAAEPGTARSAQRTEPAGERSSPAVRTRGCPRTADACVDIRAGRAWLQRHGEVVFGPVRVSTGKKGDRTPRGTFHVGWKDREHASSEYGYSMPNSVFFAAGGIAFHQGPLSRPSHGCVHLSREAARAFFAALQPGDTVVVR